MSVKCHQRTFADRRIDRLSEQIYACGGGVADRPDEQVVFYDPGLM
jgi:hypothetical protein